MGLLVLYLFVCALQTALIYYHAFSPFEREMNLRAIGWGAKPAPRFAVVVVLDLCAGLLLAILVLGVLPQAQNDAALARLLRVLPAWVAVSLLAAVLHSHVNNSIIRFPNFRLIVQRAWIELVLGALVVAGALYAVALAVMPEPSSAFTAWTRSLPAIFAPALGIALLVYVVRALAFLTRVIPLLGSFASAAVSTGILVWGIERFGQMMMGSPTPASSLGGIESIVFGVGAVAVFAMGLAWQLPGAKRHSDAVDPPWIATAPLSSVKPVIVLADRTATLASAKMRVEVALAPFGVRVKNSVGDTLWELGENGLSRDLFLYKILSIPLLYTGNTMKVKWRILSQPFQQATQIEGRENGLRVAFPHAVLNLTFHSEDILRIEFEHSSRISRHTSLLFDTAGDAHYLGLGQRFNKVDQRGEETYMLVEEGGVGYEWAKSRVPFLYPLLRRLYGVRGSFPNGEQCTGFPVPFALIARESGATTGIFWNTYKPTWFKSGTARTADDEKKESSVGIPRVRSARLTVLERQVDLFLFAGPTPMDVIQQYTTLTGRSSVPPAWAFLPWKTNTGAVVESDVRADMSRFRQLEIPLGQVGIEHWQEVRGSYEFSKRWWPHISDLIKTAHDTGYRVHIWHFPYMNTGSATHHEGVQKGYFIRNRLGLPYYQRIFQGIAGVIDYTNPQASAWHEKMVSKTFHEQGIHGVMTDYAESIPPDSVFYNGQSGISMRNAYPVLYCQAMQRAAQRVLGDDHLLYPRAGYAGSQRFVCAQWPGDQDTDWDDGDGLPAAVRAMVNASICGFPVSGSDVGGWYDWYSPITTKELYLRWAEVGCYSPLMRAHGGPIGRNREPWKFDQETIEIYRALSEEHVRLFPYFYSLAKEAAHTGKPIIRHPALIWPDCKDLYAVEDSWLIGDGLYIAPVVRPSELRREVLLPPGEWWSLGDDEPVRGPARLVVNAPLGRTPRFLRRGFILPRFVNSFDTFDRVSTAKVGTLMDDIEAWIYPGGEKATFTLFDGSRLEEDCPGTGNRKITWKIFG